MILSRRKFLTGLGAIIAAPVVVRAASLMPVKAIERHELFNKVTLSFKAEDGDYYVLDRVITGHSAWLMEMNKIAIWNGDDWQFEPIRGDVAWTPIQSRPTLLR